MSKKEQFLAFVRAGAKARDLSTENNDSAMIMRFAVQIPEDQIPGNPMAAAKTYLAFCHSAGKGPEPWILARK